MLHTPCRTNPTLPFLIVEGVYKKEGLTIIILWQNGGHDKMNLVYILKKMVSAQ